VDERVARLKTPEECDQFIINVKDRHPELVQEARRRKVELRAAAHGAERTVEREALQAVYAYEEVLCKMRGKKVRASRTWQMIDRHGLIGAVERAVNRAAVTSGYRALVEMNMPDFAFEAVVLRHPSHFSPDAIRRSEERLNNWKQEAPTQPKSD
jgi:hypothetical protein